MTDKEFVEKVRDLLSKFYEDAGENPKAKTYQEYLDLLRELLD